MSVSAIIVAAGRGTRAGGTLAKQWQPLAGARVIDHALHCFLNHPGIDDVVMVTAADQPDMQSDFPAVTCVTGGETRQLSVLAGLKAVPTSSTRVLIHDAARPCLQPHTIDQVLNALDTMPAAAPALPVVDALWRGSEGTVAGVQDRSNLFRAQTPQGFHTAAILAAHEAFGEGAADDVEVARRAGLEVAIVPGDESNIKITHPDDFARAESYLRGPMDIRIGTGFDVHRFGQGDHVFLCGVKLAHDRSLQGHSDADVGMHALTDAIYGALADGDIGQHFPPSDPQWKGAESHIFLRHAVGRATESGYQISNCDVTLICEKPKIGPHATAMRQALADIIGIDISRVSVKATTSERLGFTGREEGIAAQAAVTLVKP